MVRTLSAAPTELAIQEMGGCDTQAAKRHQGVVVPMRDLMGGDEKRHSSDHKSK